MSRTGSTCACPWEHLGIPHSQYICAKKQRQPRTVEWESWGLRIPVAQATNGDIGKPLGHRRNTQKTKLETTTLLP
ncbi:hypothetical protein ACRRTK_023255 [Alexandromys fortis]